MQDDILGWTAWNEKFHALDGILTVSELHGMMMGILCVTEAPTQQQWLQILALLKVPSLSDDVLQFLTEEAEDASYALAESELDYLPILPDDEHSLQQRVQALADWCAGLVLGFGLSAQKLTEEEMESIEILQNVASVEFDSSDDDEDGETAYEELYELVRLIPIQFSLGRPQKLAVEATSLLQTTATTSTTKKHAPQQAKDDVVEIFNPNRPS